MSGQLSEPELSDTLRKALAFLESPEKQRSFFELDASRQQGNGCALRLELSPLPQFAEDHVTTTDASLISFKEFCLLCLNKMPSSERLRALRIGLLNCSTFEEVRELEFLNPCLEVVEEVTELTSFPLDFDDLLCDESWSESDGGLIEGIEIDKDTMQQLYGPSKLLLDRPTEVPNPLIDSNSVLSAQSSPLLNQPCQREDSHSGDAPEVPHQHVSLLDQYETPLQSAALLHQPSVEVQSFSDGGPETPIQSTPLVDQPCVEESSFPNVSSAGSLQACVLMDRSEVPFQLSRSLQSRHEDTSIAPDGPPKDVSIPEPTLDRCQLTADSPEPAGQDMDSNEQPSKKQKISCPDGYANLSDVEKFIPDANNPRKEDCQYFLRRRNPNRIGLGYLYRMNDVRFEERVWMEKSPRSRAFKYQKFLKQNAVTEAFGRGDPRTVFRTGCQYEVYIRQCTVEELGMGVFAAEDIPRGKAVFEYTGDMLSTKKADKREADTGPTFMFGLDDCSQYSFLSQPLPRAIDARFAGNATRFLNHSCRPSLAVITSEDFKKYCVETYGVQRLVFRTTRKVKRGDALTIDYHPHLNEAALRKAERHLKFPCQCGQPRCRKWMFAGTSSSWL